MVQQQMIERFRRVSLTDDRVTAALMFGSFAVGEGDDFSDIEFALFIRDETFRDFDQRSWLEGIDPVAAYFQDDFGHRTALFENGIRGEFHFLRASELPTVASWQGHGWFPSLEAAVVLDRTGELSRYASVLVGGPPTREGADLVEGLCLNLINLALLGANLLNRGEFARAWALLGRTHENLLKLIRIKEKATHHWPTPSRCLEHDLSPSAYERYLTCTAAARPHDLLAGYCRTWAWGLELFDAIATPLDVRLPDTVLARVNQLLDAAAGRWG